MNAQELNLSASALAQFAAVTAGAADSDMTTDISMTIDIGRADTSMILDIAA